MASQKSLLLLLLALVVVMQQVNAMEYGDIDESDIQDAVSTLYSGEELSLEDTEELLQLISDGLGLANGAFHMLDDSRMKDIYHSASEYLAMCKKQGNGKYGNSQDYFDEYFESMLETERHNMASLSIINYLEDCLERRENN